MPSFGELAEFYLQHKTSPLVLLPSSVLAFLFSRPLFPSNVQPRGGWLRNKERSRNPERFLHVPRPVPHRIVFCV